MQGIDGLGPLPDHKLAHTEHHRSTLRLLALHRHEAHCRTHRCFADGVCSIVLLALDEGPDAGRWDYPDIITRFAGFAAPEMSAATGLDRNDARWQHLEKLQYLRSPQFLSQHWLAFII